jgi:hypothetical protein
LGLQPAAEGGVAAAAAPRRPFVRKGNRFFSKILSKVAPAHPGLILPHPKITFVFSFTAQVQALYILS